MSLRLVLLFFALTVSSGRGAEPYWNQFRGPHGNGETSTALPTEFSDSEHVKWKTPIHDKGWSSPVVWGDQIWLTTATEDGKQLYAVCVDADTGAIEHDLLVFEVAEPKYCHPTNSYASCTPFVEEGRVYVHFGEYGTACLDTTTGEKLWERRDFVCEDFRGPASSPIVEGDRLFILFDGIDHQFVVALDKHTGETLWKIDRDIDYGTEEGDYKKGYCTPTLIAVNGQEQLICPAAVETIAYDPATGEVIWRIHHEGMNAAARPIYENGLVYITAGEGDMSLAAVKPDWHWGCDRVARCLEHGESGASTFFVDCHERPRVYGQRQRRAVRASMQFLASKSGPNASPASTGHRHSWRERTSISSAKTARSRSSPPKTNIGSSQRINSRQGSTLHPQLSTKHSFCAALRISTALSRAALPTLLLLPRRN